MRLTDDYHDVAAGGCLEEGGLPGHLAPGGGKILKEHISNKANFKRSREKRCISNFLPGLNMKNKVKKDKWSCVKVILMYYAFCYI